MKRWIATAALAALALAVALPVAAEEAAEEAAGDVEIKAPKAAHDYGFVYKLKSGTYYRIDITADGTQELALSGGDFFRSIWVNEIVVNSIEIRPMGVHSIEFDEAGTAQMSFVAIVPGTYTLSVPQSKGGSQSATFVIE